MYLFLLNSKALRAPHPIGFLEALELAKKTLPITANRATKSNINLVFSTATVASSPFEYVLKITPKQIAIIIVSPTSVFLALFAGSKLSFDFVFFNFFEKCGLF